MENGSDLSQNPEQYIEKVRAMVCKDFNDFSSQFDISKPFTVRPAMFLSILHSDEQ